MMIYIAPLQGYYPGDLLTPEQLKSAIVGEHQKSQSGPCGTSVVWQWAHSRARGKPLRRRISA